MKPVEVRRSWICRCSCVGLGLLALALFAPAPAAAGLASGPSICRGAGFWSTHAGSEKGGTNMVQALLDEVGCLEVCGEVIDDTNVNNASSAEEGFCVAPKSGPQIQLARLLLTQAMNCILSTGSPDCDAEAWEVCNDACANPAGENGIFLQTCRGYLDCQSNGGLYDFESGACQTGTCELIPALPSAEGDGGLPCGPGYDACALGYACVPTVGCDDQDLVNEALGIDFTDDEQNASSSKKCNQATKTRCTIVGPNETLCTDPDGNESPDPESCPECTEGFICNVTDPVACQGSSGGFFGCNCMSTAEGGTACIQDQECISAEPCSATSECASGETCVVDSCCSFAAPQGEGGGPSGFCFQTGDAQICTDPALPQGRAGSSGATLLRPAKRQ